MPDRPINPSKIVQANYFSLSDSAGGLCAVRESLLRHYSLKLLLICHICGNNCRKSLKGFIPNYVYDKSVASGMCV